MPAHGYGRGAATFGLAISLEELYADVKTTIKMQPDGRFDGLGIKLRIL